MSDKDDEFAKALSEFVRADAALGQTYRDIMAYPDPTDPPEPFVNDPNRASPKERKSWRNAAARVRKLLAQPCCMGAEQ